MASWPMWLELKEATRSSTEMDMVDRLAGWRVVVCGEWMRGRADEMGVLYQEEYVNGTRFFGLDGAKAGDATKLTSDQDHPRSGSGL